MTPLVKPKVAYNLLPLLGSDPELFLSRNGEIIGAERVIPPEGIDTLKFQEHQVAQRIRSNYGPDSLYKGKFSEQQIKEMIKSEVRYLKESSLGKVVLDGVQVELHPRASGCRQNAAKYLGFCLGLLAHHLKDHPDVKVSFDSVVEITEKEYQELSDSSKRLGCQPSLNIYDGSSTIEVPQDYRIRSAGGHLHFGLWEVFHKDRVDLRRLVLLFDIFVGNSMVLFDRNPLQKTRREVYGRAGEYRLPDYGVEYRTLSNYWLRDHRIMSFAYGMARLAMSVLWHTELAAQSGSLCGAAGTGKYGNKVFDPFDAEREILSRISIDRIRTAINENDYNLARENWNAVASFIEDHVEAQFHHRDYQFAMSPQWLKRFDRFLEKPVEDRFPHMDDPLKKWHEIAEARVTAGWDSYIGAEGVL